jgi:alkylresorcinol/alkylpyrone synthase
VPAHVLVQSEVAEAAAQHFGGRYAEFGRLAKVFATTGIRTRRSVRPIEWFAEPRGWPERTAAYLEGAQSLFVEAASAALEAAGLTADKVDVVVTVSSTGIATPSLEARVFGRMGFRPDVSRVPVFGLGCAGGVSGLSIAARLAEARPGSTVLFVTVELCTLAFRLDQLTKANMVATALFGDGAAACVVQAGGADGLAQIEGAGEHTWAETLDVMGWNVDPEGFGVIFAQAIPPFAEAKVVSAVERALSLNQGSLDHERAVLAEYGNMSAPTVLFVLDRVLHAAGSPPERLALLALGPGFTASGLSLLPQAA